MHKKIKLALSLFFVAMIALGQQQNKSSFTVVPLGIKGGIDESNLSCYLVAPSGTNDFVAFDAGTINAGIEKAIEKTTFNVPVITVLKNYIKGYFISHAHLYHVSGLIINSPADATKTVYATEKCMKMMEDHYFNGETWANFGDEGPGFQIKKYHFQTLNIAEKTVVTNTTMTVQAYSLSHVNPFESTAFLLKNNEDYVLYLGDTGADSIEKSDKLASLWKTISPLILNNTLKGIFIEVSFPNDQPVNQLYGHLTPSLLSQELESLSKFTGKQALKSFNIIVTHVKPPSDKIALLKEQLIESNPFQVHYVFPEQGVQFEL